MKISNIQKKKNICNPFFSLIKPKTTFNRLK